MRCRTTMVQGVPGKRILASECFTSWNAAYAGPFFQLHESLGQPPDRDRPPSRRGGFFVQQFLIPRPSCRTRSSTANHGKKPREKGKR